MTGTSIETRPGGIDPRAVDAAFADASVAAQGAGVRIRELFEMPDLVEAATALATIWHSTIATPPVKPDVLRALAHAGNYVVGAERDGAIVGVSVAFLGRHDGPSGTLHDPHLHSHITGILPGAQGGRVGFALKQHQRAWALRNGIETITWTFDPLVRRNAFFNITKLGASIAAYYPHFYGAMTDGINSGDESDRCLARWDLLSERTLDAVAGNGGEPSIEAHVHNGAVALAEDGSGAPDERDAAGDLRLCWVPPDIVDLRARDADLALRWRRALRTALAAALDSGFQTAGMTRSGWYVLERGHAPRGEIR